MKKKPALNNYQITELAVLIVRDICESDPDSEPIAKCDCGGIADLTNEGCHFIQRSVISTIEAYLETME